MIINYNRIISGTWIKQKLECAAGGREFGHHLAVASRGSQLGGDLLAGAEL